MTGNKRITLLAIDAIGGCLVGACAAWFGWLTVVRNDQTAGEISELKRTIPTARQDLASLHGAHDRQRAILRSGTAELAATGQLPDQAPVEAYFRVLAELSAQHRLRVINQHPIPPHLYAGIIEHRYIYELSGALPDIVAFLSDIERTEYWADVSYLKVDRGSASSGTASAERVASVTISLFAAIPAEQSSDTG